MMKKIKRFISKNKLLSSLIKSIYFKFNKKKDFQSKNYWDERYAKGGNSGAGSYGRLAKFKAEIINDFFKKNNIKSVIEFGCGDGNQLSMFKAPKYIGLDVSKKSIEICKEKFISDKNKAFFLYPQYFIDRIHVFRADVTLSLDVIYHLIEDDIFEKYMKDLFSSSKKYVVIYSSNTDKQAKFQAQHVLHRKFSDWVEKNCPNWESISKIKNKFQLKNNEQDESFANFYIYQKKVD